MSTLSTVSATNTTATSVNSYWDGTGKYQALYEQLSSKIPASGKVAQPRKNKALEKMRCAANAYYDIFNNGGMNRYADIRYHFGVSMGQYKIGRGKFQRTQWGRITAVVDPQMDQIILNAAVEQGLLSSVEDAEMVQVLVA